MKMEEMKEIVEEAMQEYSPTRFIQLHPELTLGEKKLMLEALVEAVDETVIKDGESISQRILEDLQSVKLD